MARKKKVIASPCRRRRQRCRGRGLKTGVHGTAHAAEWSRVESETDEKLPGELGFCEGSSTVTFRNIFPPEKVPSPACFCVVVLLYFPSLR